MNKLFKQFARRAAAGVTALALCAGLAGCYSEDKTWAAKLGDETLPIGSYIYYLSSSYSEGAAKIGSEDKVLDSQIDGQDAGQWVKSRAMDYLYSYYYVDNKFEQLGLTLSEEDETSIDSASASMWSYYGKGFEEIGIAEASFKKSYAEYNTKLSNLLCAMYGKGGEMEVPESELHDYYTGEYTYYQYFIVDLTKTDEGGASINMEDDEKQEVRTKLEGYVKDISSGNTQIDTAAANYANSSGTEPNLGEPVAIKTENMSELFKSALDGIDMGEAAFIDATTRYYVVQKLDVEDDFEAILEDQDRYDSLLREIKGEEFVDYTIEQGKALDIQVNDKAINSVKLSAIVKAMGSDKGTSSAEESSSSESGSSSQESSEESGEDEGSSEE